MHQCALVSGLCAFDCLTTEESSVCCARYNRLVVMTLERTMDTVKRNCGTRPDEMLFEPADLHDGSSPAVLRIGICVAIVPAIKYAAVAAICS